MIGIGVTLFKRMAGGSRFSPSSLFSSGEQGVWYDPSAASGSLDWRKNLLEYTESFYQNWNLQSGTVRTANQTAPDGTSTASKFVSNGSNGFFGFSQVLLGTNIATRSIWLKGVSGGETVLLKDPALTNNIITCNLTTEWQRFQLTEWNGHGANGGIWVDNIPAGGIYAWGPQIEFGTTASSYQPILSTFESAFKAANPSHTLYQDSQGVTPVTAVGQPVGLMLDKSEGLKQGPELVTNGDFATDSDWTKSAGWSISNGTAVSSGSTGTALSQGNVFTLNKTYRITADVTVTAGELRIWDAASGQPSLAVYSGAVNVVFTPTSNTTLYLLGVSNFVGTIDNVSVTEIQGSHATQPTSTKRPIYARHPEGGIRNLLNYTEQFDNGAWIKISTGGAAVSVIPSSYVAPDGTYSATQVLGLDTANSRLDQNTVLPALANKTYTYSVWLRGSGVIGINASSTTGIGGSTEVTITLTSTWTRHDVTHTFNSSPTGDVRVHGVITRATGTAPEVHMWSPQLEEATEASNYQKRVTDIDVTESGVGEVYYLKFDGVSDGMFINNLTSPNTPLTAWFGYSATNANSGNYKFLLDIQTGRTIFAASANVAGNIGYFDGAWSKFEADSNALKVLTYDLVEDNAKIRIDGTQEYSDTAYDQRAIGGNIGLFQNHFSPAAYAFVAGNLYSCILRAAESTDKEIASTESYVAKKTGLLAQVDGIATLSLDFGGNTYTARNSNGGIL